MNLWKLSTFAFASLFAASIAVGSIDSADAAPQPVMKAALSSLKTAASKLKKATDDKGGHRVNAIRLTNEAIAEVEAGIKYDNKH